VATIVVDLGGTFLRIGVVDGLDLRRLEATRLAEFGERNGDVWDDVVASVAAFSARLEREGVPLEGGIAIAFPGPVAEGGVVAGAPTVVGASRVIPDLAAAIALATRRPAVLLNDVSAAAWYFGDRLSSERFGVVTVSSGIGAKIYDRGRRPPVLDLPPYAGELGHIVVDRGPHAPACDCGGRGHLGAIASGRGFERLARLELADPTLTNEADLIPALRAGEPLALALLHASVRPLAGTLAALIVGAGLERIVVIGGFARALGTLYRDVLTAELAGSFDAGPIELDLEGLVTVCGPDEEPSLLGAARFAQALTYAR
jgi:predicted NBD/HSP70 family sugar kinase